MPGKYAGRLEITTRIGCSVNCVYCPQKLLVSRYCDTAEGKPVVEMTLETFKACIDKTPAETRIDFSGMAEPWLNRACTEMVQYAAQKGHPIAVYTTLVGMTKEDFDALREIPMEEFVLHIPDDKSNSHINVTPEYIALLERAIHEEHDGKPIVTGYSCHAGIHPAILAAIPKDGKLITELHDRAGNVGDSEYVEHAHPKGQVVCINCEAGINHNVLLPDGRVVLCCMDYGMKHVLGNLLHQSWDEIHESEEALRVIAGLSDDTADTLCRSCVNAKNIYDVYQEMRLYQDWTRNLLHQQDETAREVRSYQDWVHNLQKQDDEARKALQKYQEDEDRKDRYLQEAAQQIRELEKEKQEKSEELERRSDRLRREQERREQTESQLHSAQDQLTAAVKRTELLEQELKEIKDSRAYRVLTVYKKLRGNR